MNFTILLCLVLATILATVYSSRNWVEIRDAPDFNNVIAFFLCSWIVVCLLCLVLLSIPCKG